MTGPADPIKASDQADSEEAAEYAHPVAIAKLTESKSYSLTPDADALKRIAKRLKIPGVKSLSGEIGLTPISAGVRLKGRLTSRLQRICVISLEPMTESVEEYFAIDFIAGWRDEEEAEIDPDAPVVEPLPEDALDLGEILVQQLALAMAAYPRKPDAQPVAGGGADQAESSPFSVLKGLSARGESDANNGDD